MGLGGRFPIVGALGEGPQAPSSLGDLLGRLLPAEAVRLPVPEAAGNDALAAAVAAYAEATRVEEPDPAALAARVAELGLDATGQRALARLILAYAQAVELQRQATSGLDAGELLLVAGDPAATDAWLARHPEAGDAGLQAEQARLRGKVDIGLTLQGTDLLARTLEEVRGPLALSAAAGAAANRDVGLPADPWQTLHLALLGDATAPPRPALQADLTLATALADLARTVGVPASTVPAPAFPPSLDHALALLVQAKADGMAGLDPLAEAVEMLEAAEAAQPTLEAWAAILRLGSLPASTPAVEAEAVMAQAVRRDPDPAAIVAAALQADAPAQPASPLHQLLARQGMDPATARVLEDTLPAPLAQALAVLLAAREGLDGATWDALAPLTAAQAAAVRQPEVLARLSSKASWTPAEARWMRDWAEGMARVPPGAWDRIRAAQQHAVAATGQARQLLQPLVQPASAPPPPTPPDSVPLPNGNTVTVPSTPRVPALPVGVPPGFCPTGSVPALLDIQDCEHDVWLRFVNNEGTSVIVTGLGSTRLDVRYTDGLPPQILIDLGGDDDYEIPVGVGVAGTQFCQKLLPSTADSFCDGLVGYTQQGGFTGLAPTSDAGPATAYAAAYTSGRAFSVALDLGGSDEYTAPGWGQGVGAGVGAVGILWDTSGDDRYATSKGEVGQDGSQGFGYYGGVGVLADGSGSDGYDAPSATAQGVAAAPILSLDTARPLPNPLAPVGLLLDAGPGTDRYQAFAGQGFSSGVGATGLLVDTEGDSVYSANPSSSSQGDRGATSPFAGALFTLTNLADHGLGGIVDLGGEDAYSHRAVRSSTHVVARPGAPLERHDDAVWMDAGPQASVDTATLMASVARSVGLGIDSTLDDGDGNGLPDLIDLLGGKHGQSVQEALAHALDDHDGDGSPDTVEASVGSDPANATSTPLDGPQAILYDDRLLCNAAVPGCAVANPGDLAACDPLRAGSCVSLLSVGGIGRNLFDHPALVSVDLGGSDTYTSVAGGMVTLGLTSPQRGAPTVFQNATTSSLDLAGDDRYDTPTLDSTQGSAGTLGVTPATAQALAVGPWHYPAISIDTRAALLLDLAGNDTYRAGAGSQGAGWKGGIGLLADLQGNDIYAGGADSQARASCDAFRARVEQGTAVPLTAATAPCWSTGLLVDLDGDDDYAFDRQAFATGQGAFALLLDGRGTDTYRSRTPVEAGFSAASPNDAFDAQGAAQARSAALFLDNGTAADHYLAPGKGSGPQDLSALKNSLILRTAPTADGLFTVRFADNPGAAADDTDGDDARGAVELLSGHRANDPASAPGTLQQGQTGTDGSSPLAATDRPLNALVGDPGIELARGLVIGGAGPSTYAGVAPPFLVDLGGNDLYTSPNTALASPAANLASSSGVTVPGFSSVYLVLDVGDGTDRYLPDPAPCRFKGLASDSNAALARHCGSLGAAIGPGIAILADAGGRNEFQTFLEASGTISGPVAPAWTVAGCSQGAGCNRGVGILATWDSSNTFTANVTLRVAKAGALAAGGAIPSIQAFGGAQGAGFWGGIGVLATFGSGSDVYRAEANATLDTVSGNLPAFAFGAAQGAGWGFPEVSTSNAGAVAPLLGSMGILADGGGSNQFLALQGAAQGAGWNLGMGVLWSGAADDRHVAGPLSQAWSGPAGVVPGLLGTPAALTGPGQGILADSGGNDTYLIASAPRAPTTHLAPLGGPLPVTTGQGAGQGALLIDWAGDDLYDAAGWTGAQGAFGGSLVDLGGDDAHWAAAFSQGYGGQARLVDLAGWDGYTLDPGAAGQGTTGALFLDAAGTDRYTGPPGRANNQTWNCSSETSGCGADQPTLDAALAALAGPGTTLDVRITTDPAGNQPLGNARARGVLHLFTTVTPAPGLAVERTAFLVNGSLLGEGVPVPGQPNVYTAEWNTNTMPDGPYDVRAAAYLAPVNGPPGAPDLGYAHSPPANAWVDSLPTLAIRLSAPAIAPRGEGAPKAVILSATIPSDGPVFPTGTSAAACAPGTAGPGSWLSVQGTSLQGAGFSITRYACAGTTPLQLDAGNLVCAGAPCPDGIYTLTAVAVDGGGAPSHPRAATLLLDSTAPVSDVTLPPIVGNAARIGTGLSVPLSSNDVQSGLPPAQVSGTGTVTLLALNPDWSLRSEVGTASASTGFVVMPDVQSGDVLYLVAVAQDTLGNLESPCQGGEPFAGATHCMAAKRGRPGAVHQVAVDFLAPTLLDATLAPAYVRPGAPITFSARLNGTGSAIDLQRSFIRFDDGFQHPLSRASPTGDLYVYDGWNATPSNQGRAGREESFTATLDAFDAAGNDAALPLSGVIDGLSPRIELLPAQYLDEQGAAFSVGRPGLTALVRAQVTDFQADSVTAVRADFRSVGGAAAATCQRGEAGVWACATPLGALPNGNYSVPLSAVDRAGNWNNGTVAALGVHGTPLHLSDVRVEVEDITPTSFTVRWASDVAASSLVRYGKVQPLAKQAVPDGDGQGTNHTVTVTGLAPATQYLFQAESTSAAGVTNQTLVTSQTAVTTLHGFDLLLPEPVAGQAVGGVLTVPLEVVDHMDGEAVDVDLKLQDGAGASTPLQVAQLRDLSGASDVDLNTSVFPDGAYRLVAVGTRGGDTVTVTSPAFRIDNTAPVVSPTFPEPGSLVAQGRPQLSVRILDPLGDRVPPIDGASLLIDGEAVEAQVVEDRLAGGGAPQRAATLQPVQPLGDGRHTARLVVADAAGNVGAGQWNFTVDTRAPRVEGAPRVEVAGNRSAARHGALVHVQVVLADPASVASAAIDLAPLGGELLPLVLSQGAWDASFTVPSGAQDGAWKLRVEATDGLGNLATAATVPLTIDATPPRPQGHASDATKTGATVEVTSDEPVTAQVLEGGRVHATARALAASHALRVDGLRPGRAYTLAVDAVDGAGNNATASVEVRTLPDQAPPGAAEGVQAVSSAEGVVDLRWSAASDDSGILAYRIERSAEGQPPWGGEVAGNATQWRDAEAPAGRTATYTVTPVDLADRAGPPRQVRVAVLALPHLLRGSLSPGEGSTADPFVAQVTYRHASGRPADRVELMAGPIPHPLALQAGGDCARGCLYEAVLRLPAASMADRGNFSFVAAADGQQAHLLLAGRPVVHLAPDGDNPLGVHVGDGARPSPGAGVLALLLLLALARARPRRPLP